MKREDLVGTIRHAGTPHAMLLLEFLGEGSTSVGYLFGDATDGTPSGKVVTTMKPQAWLEMETLHHDFAVHERLYPHHPLRMTAERRFALLEAEMLARVDAGRTIHRVSSYHYVLERTLTALATKFFDAFAQGALTADLVVQHPGIRLFLDENLAGCIQDHLDEALFVEEYEGFFTHVLALLPAAIEVLKDAAVYRPIARNPIASLAGLHVVDFISREEMDQIARREQFRVLIARAHLEDALGFGEVLFGCAGGRDRWLPSPKATADIDANADQHAPDRELSEAALAVYELTRTCAMLPDIGDPQLAGRARADSARASMLETGPRPEAINELEAALDELRAADAPVHVHDVLLDLHHLYAATDAARSQECMTELLAIRTALESTSPTGSA